MNYPSIAVPFQEKPTFREIFMNTCGTSLYVMYLPYPTLPCPILSYLHSKETFLSVSFYLRYNIVRVDVGSNTIRLTWYIYTTC